MRVGATVAVATMKNNESSIKELSLEDYVKREGGEKGTILVRVMVPYTVAGTHFQMFKTAARNKNSHAFANAAQSTVVSDENTITSARIVYGGPFFTRLKI
jgi:xanthine dehydrogenase iron-sulfur cluster and FAD-binding subunit A